MIPPPPPSEAPDCRFTPIFGGRRLGPSTCSPAYQLVFNNSDHVSGARLAVASWAGRIHQVALIRAEVLRLEQAAADAPAAVTS